MAALAVAACSPPAPGADSEGQAARKLVDTATTTYANCVTAATKAIDVKGENAGTLALLAMKQCAAQRTDLIAKVGNFYRLGHPVTDSAKQTYEKAKAVAVAEASVQTIEDDMRQAAVVTIVSRQTDADRAVVN